MASSDGQYHIVPATGRDLWAVRRLERAAFGRDAYPWYEILGLLTMPGLVRLKAVDGRGELVGFVAGDPQMADRVGWVITIAVDAAHRRRGVGRRLLAACEAALAMPVVRLTVRVSNVGAIALYERCGYVHRSRWPGYYRDGEDGLVMEKTLTRQPAHLGRRLA